MSEKQGIQSADAALRILQVLADSKRAMTLTDIASRTDMTPSTAHRYLTSFIRFEMATQDPSTSHYDLGPFALRLGLSALGRVNSVEVSGEVLKDLRDEIDMPVFLSIWTRQGPTIVRWLDASNFLSVSMRLGSNAPLLTAASGRAFLAFENPRKIEKLLQQELAARQARQEKSFTTMAEVLALQSSVREQRVACTQGERIQGVNGLSVPVFDSTGDLACTLTAVGLEQAFDNRRDGDIARKMLLAGWQASSRLGYNNKDFYETVRP